MENQIATNMETQMEPGFVLGACREDYKYNTCSWVVVNLRILGGGYIMLRLLV